ncbi:hypothetical protein BD626DRAFT_572377 [Schizophyllum amplum]|uniref:BTB domain-containing protein n=1 Tax=Schizophyllum amplum TaxID=97359 RepID=A0A550C4G8_9AGAR|nr:hypothetical protein BD626DRAFT_572377 [Auriculariopsis ampla]
MSIDDDFATSALEIRFRTHGGSIFKAENTVFRFHSYHLELSTTFFNDHFSDGSGALKARTKHTPSISSMECTEEWDAAIWQSILRTAETYSMSQIARVACHALDRLHALSDPYKVALSVDHGMGKFWAAPELQRLIQPATPLLSIMEVPMNSTTLMRIMRSREYLIHSHTKELIELAKKTVPCEWWVHGCNGKTLSTSVADSTSNHTTSSRPHFVECRQQRNILASDAPSDALVESVAANSDVFPATNNDALPPSPPRCFMKGHPSGDVFFQVEDRVIQTHTYHFARASATFADMFSLTLENGPLANGATADDAIKLDHVKVGDFENLLYFFYYSAHEWLPTIVDPTTIKMWESTLHLADLFDMQEVKDVALYALGRPGALTDVHKISVCMLYDDIPRTWAETAFSRVCTRTKSLEEHEIEQLPLSAVSAIIHAREELLRDELRKAAGAMGMTPTARQKIKRFRPNVSSLSMIIFTLVGVAAR